MALDHALLKSRDLGRSPDTLRYMFFKHDTVLVGYHQCVDLEINRDYCREHGIEINRRLTGGGAILMQPAHIGFEIICDADFFNTGLNRKRLYQKISEPVVNAFRRIGLDASYRPLNDIEIKGRKVSGTGGVDGKKSLLFHGSILMDMDFDTMIGSLNIPIEKLSDKFLSSILDRMTTIQRELGHSVSTETFLPILTAEFKKSFSVDLARDTLSAFEEDTVHETLDDYRSDAWVQKIRMPPNARQETQGLHKAPGGLIRAVLVLDQRNRQIQSAMISGDFFATDPRLLLDIEARLKGSSIHPGQIRWHIHQVLRGNETTIPGVTADDFTQAVINALPPAPPDPGKEDA